MPSVARDLFDLAGRWGRERSPQRREFTVGTHLREGRKGRTGADAATVLHAGVPGFTFGAGEVWGVHVGWSGNHTHYAERLSTGEQVLGGGELLLPGEVVLGPVSYTHLDVYKRQDQGSAQVLPDARRVEADGARLALGPGCCCCARHLFVLPPVSYTHLDVYKRQPWPSSRPSRIG